MRHNIRNLCCAIILLCTALAIPTEPATATIADPGTGELFVWRVYLRQPSDTQLLTSGGWDVLEARGPDYLLVMGTNDVAARLRAQGFTLSIDHTVAQTSGRAYYDGYRTVVEHYQHLDDVVTLYPTLAMTVTYGVSWQRQQSPSDGHDLRAICITHLRPGDCALNPHSSKPRFFMMAAIHARELSTSELAWRWIDYLVTNDAAVADIWALLEYNEMWIVPVTNPDGRAAVESGGSYPLYQRKNLDTSNGICGSLGDGDQPGIDLNRNAKFKWGGLGASTYACSLTYRGPSAASEPEEYFLESLMSGLFPDQRGELDTDAAPITTTGAMLTLHSFSNLVLLPWGWTNCPSGQLCPLALRAPNDIQLRGLAFHMSYHNGYLAGTGSEALYVTSGSTDDWAYGVLGIPGFTFEVGPSDWNAYPYCGDFMPDYTCQDNRFFPDNRGAFLYLAKVAYQPYALGLGPVVDVTPISPTLGVTATVASNRYGNSGYGRPSVLNVKAARYSIDAPPWLTTSISMTAKDGHWNSTVEVVSATLPLLTPGRHTLYIQGQDTANHWGPVTAQWVMTAPIRLWFPYVSRE
jgi:carboxypeptidase T